MCDVHARRADGAASSRRLPWAAPAALLPVRAHFFVFSEHFESVSLHWYRRRLKSPLVASGPLGVRKKSSLDFQKVIGSNTDHALGAAETKNTSKGL